MMNLYIHSAVQLLVKFNMADLKGQLRKKVETLFVTEYAFYIYYFYGQQSPVMTKVNRKSSRFYHAINSVANNCTQLPLYMKYLDKYFLKI